MLREALLRFECGMRKLLLTNVWWGTLGHTRLTRITAEDREWKQKVDTKKKKQDRVSPFKVIKLRSHLVDSNGCFFLILKFGDQ